MTTKITASAFDDWSEEKDQEAIERLRKEFKVRTIIVEQKLLGKFSSGEVVELPLKMKLETMEQAQKAGGDDDIEVVKQMLKGLGDQKNYGLLIVQDVGEIFNFVTRYFETWQKINGLTSGE